MEAEGFEHDGPSRAVAMMVVCKPTVHPVHQKRKGDAPHEANPG